MASKIDNVMREALVGMMMEAAEAKGWAVERIDDYATVAIEVVVGEDIRWMKVKASAPKLADKEGNILWEIDEAIQAYVDRVEADKEKEQVKAEKAAESARKKAEKAAKNSEKK